MISFIFEEPLIDSQLSLIRSKMFDKKMAFNLTGYGLSIMDTSRKHEIEQFLIQEGIGFEL